MSWLSKATGIHVSKWKTTTDPGSFGRALSDLGSGLVNVVRNPFSSAGYKQMGQGAQPVATAAVLTAAGMYAFSGPGATASPSADYVSGTDLEAASGAGQGGWFEPSVPPPASGLELEAASGAGQGGWFEPVISKSWYAPLVNVGEKLALPVALKMLTPSNVPASQGYSPGYTIYNAAGGQDGGGSPGGGGGSWSDFLSEPSVGGLPMWATYAAAAVILALAIAASRKR